MCAIFILRGTVLYSCRDDPCAESSGASAGQRGVNRIGQSSQSSRSRSAARRQQGRAHRGKSAHVVAPLPRGPQPRRRPREPRRTIERNPGAWEYRVPVPQSLAAVAAESRDPRRFCFCSKRFPVGRRRVAQIMPRTCPTCKGYSYNSSLQARRPD